MTRELLFALVGLLAARPAASESMPSYSAEPVVIRHASTVIDMKADGTGEQTETVVVAVQSDAAVKQFSVVSTFYAKQSQHAEFVYVRVRHPDGSTVETTLGDVQDQAAPVTQQAPFYSDLMIKQLPVKGLRVGDTLEWQTHNVRTVAEAPNQFWGAENFARDVVVEDQTIELRVPSSVKLTVKTKSEPKSQLVESDADGRHVYSWSSKQLDPTVGPQAEAQKKAKKSRPLSAAEQQDVTEGALPDVAWTTFPSWEAVGAWYRSLEGERMQPDEAIRAKVAEITTGKATQEEKVRAVYAWVSGQIRYVGVALGIGRYQPHTAGAVLDNQYGDCKDKHTLLAAMLVTLGLRPDAVLAGQGVRFNRDVPSPASFNHLITRVTVDGKEVWMDSTAEVAGYRVLLAIERDKDVLAVPQTGPATIVHTPANLPFKPESTFAVAGSLDDKLASDSKITMMHHDDLEVFLRAAFRQTSPSGYEDLMQSVMANYGFGGKVSEVEVEHISDPSQPLTIRLHYHRDHGDDWGEERITAIFGPTMLPMVDKKDLPRSPLELGSLHTDTSTLQMKLPQGWNGELPEATHQHTPQAECDVTYRLKDGGFMAERRITVLQTKVPVDDLKAYADWYDTCGAGSVPYLQLVKVSGPSGGSESSGLAQTQARHLVDQANTEIREGKYDEAETNLKQAQTMDAGARDLSGDLGAVAMHHGDHEGAMRLYAKELDLHPEAEFAYRNLASLQSLSGNKAASQATLARWQKQAPANPVPSMIAVQMLLDEKDYAAALKRAKAAEEQLEENARKEENFRMVLGMAEIQGGETDAGEALLRTIATDSKDLGRRNSASYELAAAGRDLSLAEQTERAVLDRLAAESRTWTGSESQTLLRQKSSLMVACWDTMGWILFKQGKTAEAEAWIRPAMVLHQNVEVGEHLGDLLMAEKKISEAVTAYAEALATLPLSDGLGIRLKIDPPRTKEIKAKLASAMAAIKMANEPDGRIALQALRMWKLGAADGMHGTESFLVLLSPGGVASAQDTGVGDHKMQKRVEEAKWSDRFPPGEDSRLAEKVFLNCHDGACELVIEP